MATTTFAPRGRQNSITVSSGHTVPAGGHRKDSHIIEQAEYPIMDSNSDASFQGDFNPQNISQKSTTPPSQPRDYRNCVYSPPSASTPSTCVFNFATQQQPVVLQRTHTQPELKLNNTPTHYPASAFQVPTSQPTVPSYGYQHHIQQQQQSQQQQQHRNCSPPLQQPNGPQLHALMQNHPQLLHIIQQATTLQHQQLQKQHAQQEHEQRTRRFRRWVDLTLQNRESISKLNRDDQFRMICNLSLQALAEEALSR